MFVQKDKISILPQLQIGCFLLCAEFMQRHDYVKLHLMFVKFICKVWHNLKYGTFFFANHLNRCSTFELFYFVLFLLVWYVRLSFTCS